MAKYDVALIKPNFIKINDFHKIDFIYTINKIKWLLKYTLW
jgi:hypothetical protein